MLRQENSAVTDQLPASGGAGTGAVRLTDVSKVFGRGSSAVQALDRVRWRFLRGSSPA